jgi:hypothetical protein
MKNELKKYEIEYRLHYNKYDFDTCTHTFKGINKTDAIKTYRRQTGIPSSRIISIELI